MFLPFAIFFQTIPIIAIAPLLVIYFGFGAPTAIASSTIVGIFPMIANCVVSLSSTPRELLQLFELYKSSRWQTFWKLQLPNAYLGIFSGIKVCAGLCVIGAVAGEFVGGGGIGALIDSARTQQRLDIVYASLLLLSLIGLLLMAILNFCHNFILKIRPLAPTSKSR